MRGSVLLAARRRWKYVWACMEACRRSRLVDDVRIYVWTSVEECRQLPLVDDVEYMWMCAETCRWLSLTIDGGMSADMYGRWCRR